MADMELRDASGSLKGRIKESGSKLEIRDSSGSIKGTYDPKSNETRNASGSIVGKGNWLAALLGITLK